MDDTRFVDISLSKSSESFAAAVDIDGFLYSSGLELIWTTWTR